MKRFAVPLFLAVMLIAGILSGCATTDGGISGDSGSMYERHWRSCSCGAGCACPKDRQCRGHY